MATDLVELVEIALLQSDACMSFVHTHAKSGVHGVCELGGVDTACGGRDTHSLRRCWTVRSWRMDLSCSHAYL